ncbi:MAG: hypothetical protein AAF512_10380 [Pseudomonadota bacterium]
MSDKAAEKQGMATAEAFIDAFNAQDHERLAGTLNYPHVRLANGKFVTTESFEQFVAGSQRGKAHLDKEGWHHTVTTNMEVVHSAEDKVHIAMTNDRCHEDGTVYMTFDTLWIATLQEGHWGIQFRSSYLH